MKTVREEIARDVKVGVLDPRALPLLDDFECRVWKKWDALKTSFVVRLVAGIVESKVLRPILGERPAACP